MPTLSRLAVCATIIIAALSMEFAQAASGCCSHHGGVAGCGCADGTPLSTTCAASYPQCSGESSSRASSLSSTRMSSNQKQPSKAARGHCSVNGALPDSTCTPGAVFPNATKAQICVSGYTKTVRNVSTTTKNKVFAEYGILTHSASTYEVDHLIPLELGGSNDLTNLWPEAANPTPGFHEKDKVENSLHAQLCNGSISLQDAQKTIATNWQSAQTSISTDTNQSSSVGSLQQVTELLAYMVGIQGTMQSMLLTAEPAKLPVLKIDKEGVDTIVKRLKEIKIAASSRSLTATEQSDLNSAGLYGLHFLQHFKDFYLQTSA